MKRLGFALAFVLSPLPALADDASYCADLSTLALKNLSKYALAHPSYDVDVTVSVDQCKRGNYAGGIPTLERKLLANGYKLPPR